MRAISFLFRPLPAARAYWRNAEKGQVVTVVTGTAAAVTGKRVRWRRRARYHRCRRRRRAIQRCVCAKKKKKQPVRRTRGLSAAAAGFRRYSPFRRRRGTVISTRTWLVGRVYRPWRNNNRVTRRAVTSRTPRAEATTVERIDRCRARANTAVTTAAAAITGIIDTGTESARGRSVGRSVLFCTPSTQYDSR